MERNLFIELLEDGDNVSLYSPHFDIQIKQKEKDKVITVSGTELLGELTFTINDD